MNDPVYFPNQDTILRFTIPGRPIVQKNNLNIYMRKIGNKRIPFIDHNKKMKDRRDEISHLIFKEYHNLGYTSPIYYPIEINFDFYITRVSEPDLDNLPSIVLDAMQGLKAKGGLKVAVTLEDDKLYKKGCVHKIVQGDIAYHGEPRTEVEVRRYRG